MVILYHRLKLRMMRKMTTEIDVLVVEDESLLLGMYKGLFSTFTDYTLETATSFEEAVALLETYSFKVGVIDLMISGKKNGIELGSYISTNYPDMVLFAMTGLSAVFDSFDPAVAGFETCFSKPTEFDDLFKAISKAIGRDNNYPPSKIK